MILIGTMNVTRTIERGDFYCPHCTSLQTHRLRSRRPFLTLYFIPTIPIGGAEPFVQCDHCRSTWDTSVLNLDKTAHEEIQAAQFRDEALRASVLVAMGDGGVSETEVQALLEIADTLLEYQVDREELGRLCSIARQTGVTAENYVLTVSRRWNVPQRLFAVQAMFLAATAGEKELSPGKLKQLRAVQTALNLSDTEFKAAIDDALLYDLV